MLRKTGRRSSTAIPTRGIPLRALLCASLVLLLLAACRGMPTLPSPDVPATPTRAGALPPAPSVAGHPDARLIQPKFDHYSIEHGLSQSVAYCILQDSRGFLWIGTEDGLNRFDGYDFRVHRHDPEDPDSLSNSMILAIHEGPSGALWIATYGGGLNRYDLETGHFTRYRHDPDDPDTPGGDTVLSVYEDRSGIVWVGTSGGGLDRFDPATGRWRHFRHDPDDPHSLGSDTVGLIFQDASGALWLDIGAGLERLDPESVRASETIAPRFTHYRHDPDDPHSLGRGGISSIVQDRTGALWIGTGVGGLSVLADEQARETGTFIRYEHDPDDPHSLSDNAVRAVLQDSSGVFWVGTSVGLDRYDPGGEPEGDAPRFTHDQHRPGDPDSLSGNIIWSIYEDRSGGIWIGTYGGGLNRYDRRGGQFAHYRANPDDPNSLSENGIWAIHEDPSGVLWIGTQGGGLNRYDRRAGEWRHYRHDPDDPHSLSHDIVYSILRDREGTLWIGTAKGLNRLDRESGHFVRYQRDPDDPHSLSNDTIWFILQDREGALWLGTNYGLNRFDPASALGPDGPQFTHYTHDPGDPTSLSNNRVWPIHQDRSGALWIGTNGGLNVMDPESVRGVEAPRFTRYLNDPDDPQSLSNNAILSIHEDRSGTLWIGTWGGGLNKLDRESGTFARYWTKDGLPNDVIYGILEDDEGNLWLSTNNGVSRFDPRAGTFRNYGVHDGLQSIEFDLNAYYKSSSGEMFFGGINGLNAFYPNGVRDNPYVPPIVLTSITQDREAVDLGVAVEAVRQVTFKWPDNDFEFEYAALNYFQPEKNQYAYMLEGYDDDWNHVGTRRYGGYTSLPGGTYVLRIIGSNNDGVWNEEGVSVAVAIVPPFWAAWWFRGLLASLLTAAAVGGFRLRIVRIQARSRELEIQVANRTKELAGLNAISAAVSHFLDLDEVLSHAVDKTLQVMEVEAGGIYLLDETARVLTLVAHQGLSPRFVAGVDRLQVGEGLSGRVVESGEALVVRDVSADPRLTRSVVKEEGLRSLAIAPLSSKGKELGTLFAVTHGYREFTDRDVELLSSIARQIGVAIDNARLFEAEQHRAEQFRVISQVGHHLTSILDIDELLDEVVRALYDTFGYYAVGIGLIEGDALDIKAAAGTHWRSPERPSLRIGVGQEGVMGWVAAAGEPLLVPDVSQEARYLKWPEDTETRSELAVPLKTQSGVIGALNVESDQLNAFDPSDLAVLQSLANQVAIAIENARLFVAEQRRTEQFRAISEVGRYITSILDVDELLREIVHSLQAAFGYHMITVGLIEEDQIAFRAGVKTGWHEPQFLPPPLEMGGPGITAWVAATGEPLLAPDVSQEPRFRFLADAAETRSELAVPLKTQSGVIGVLNVESDQLNAFDESDLAVLQLLARQAAIAIENARLYEQAQQLAVMEERGRLARDLHDAVTQTLFSASLIAEALPPIWERDPEEGQQLLGELRQLTRGALAEMRTLLLELRPAVLAEARLEDLLRQIAEAATGREGVPVAVTVQGECPLPSDVLIVFYRIAQEALNNVVKHARASRVTVDLLCTPSLPSPSQEEGSEDLLRAPSLPSPAQGEGMRVELRICDDGSGFDPDDVPPDRLGLGIMRERAQTVGATLAVQSQLGCGTEIVVLWQGDK